MESNLNNYSVDIILNINQLILRITSALLFLDTTKKKNTKKKNNLLVGTSINT